MRYFKLLWLMIVLLFPAQVFAGGAQYTIPNTFVAGTNAESAKVNENFDTITSNHNPAGMDDTSEDAAAHIVTKTPVSVLPTTLAEEIHESRYKDAEFNPNATNWNGAYIGYGYGYGNIAPNGGFELWSSGVPVGWSLVGGATVARAAGGANGYEDDVAVAVTSAGITSNGIKYTFQNLKASTHYSVTVAAKVTAGDTAKASTTGASSNLSETTTTQTWVYSLNGTFTTDATPADVVLILGSDTSGDIVYFDSVMVNEGKMPHAYARYIPSTPFLPRSYLAGLTLSNDTDTEHDINVFAGEAKNSANSESIVLPSTITKQIDATWAEGDDAGGLMNGTVTSNVWYTVCAIKSDVVGTVEIGFDDNILCSNIPAGYTAYRRIGSVLTDGSANILNFSQVGDEFLWDDPPDDLNKETPTNTGENFTLSTPLGVFTRAIINVLMSDGNPGEFVYVSAIDQNNEAASATDPPFFTVRAEEQDDIIANWLIVRTSTSSQIRLYPDAAGTEVSVVTLGYLDRRGRDD